jgi:hypothetical protein
MSFAEFYAEMRRRTGDGQRYFSVTVHAHEGSGGPVVEWSASCDGMHFRGPTPDSVIDQLAALERVGDAVLEGAGR